MLHTAQWRLVSRNIVTQQRAVVGSRRSSLEIIGAGIWISQRHRPSKITASVWRMRQWITCSCGSNSSSDAWWNGWSSPPLFICWRTLYNRIDLIAWISLTGISSHAAHRVRYSHHGWKGVRRGRNFSIESRFFVRDISWLSSYLLWMLRWSDWFERNTSVTVIFMMRRYKRWCWRILQIGWYWCVSLVNPRYWYTISIVLHLKVWFALHHLLSYGWWHWNSRVSVHWCRHVFWYWW